MSASKTKGKRDKPVLPPDLPSSPGDSPVELTPLDVSPDVAAWRDLTPRNITSQDPDEREDALLDEAIELSFPASDPIAVTPLPTVRMETKSHKQEDKELDDAIQMSFPASDPVVAQSSHGMHHEAEPAQENAEKKAANKEARKSRPKATPTSTKGK